MTTPIEALTYISNARWNENADLDDICTMADRALASLEGDAVERVARIIDPQTFASIEYYAALSEPRDEAKAFEAYPDLKESRDTALTKARSILATGLAPDEAAIRAAHIKVLRGLLYSCAEQANVTGPDKTTGRHMINLIDTIERSPDMPVDKIARWTGFIQGVLAARGLLDVDEERNRTRPIFAAAAQEQNDASN